MDGTVSIDMPRVGGIPIPEAVGDSAYRLRLDDGVLHLLVLHLRPADGGGTGGLPGGLLLDRSSRPGIDKADVENGLSRTIFTSDDLVRLVPRFLCHDLLASGQRES